MHIVGGQIQAQSQHQFNHFEQRVSTRPPQTPTVAPTVVKSAAPPATNNSTASPADPGVDKELSLLKALVEALTGKQIHTLVLNDSAPASTDVSAPVPSTGNSGATVTSAQINETESTQVELTGQFSSADGSQISVDLQYSLQRNYSSSTSTVSGGGAQNKAKDPIVLNFNGQGAVLEPQRKAFDLNGDGQADAIPTLAAGSAYLALDRNGDGKVNNGSELFGPTTNNGYAELAKLDSDGNGFIDSADPAFSKLLLFRPGEQTQTLASSNVGAISVSNIASPARLTDSNNQSLGQLRATGFYLTNSGGAGLVQQLDLTT